jgi:hypothetical protein
MSRGFSFRSSVSAFGGLLIIWNSDEAEVWSSFSDGHLLLIHGKFILTDEEFYLINLYGPCDVATQQLLLWERLIARIGNYVGRNLGFCGDFNVVCSLEERKGAGTFQRLAGYNAFNRLIDDTSLINLLLAANSLSLGVMEVYELLGHVFIIRDVVFELDGLCSGGAVKKFV